MFQCFNDGNVSILQFSVLSNKDYLHFIFDEVVAVSQVLPLHEERGFPRGRRRELEPSGEELQYRLFMEQ